VTYRRARTPLKRGILIASILALSLLQLAIAPAAAVSAVFGTPSAVAAWGTGIEFSQPVTLGPIATLARVELLLDLPGTDVRMVREVVVAPGTSRLTNTLDALETGLLPNTRITGRWRVTGTDGSIEVGPPSTARYEDTRFEWQTAGGSLVRVHWYQGDAGFGQRALQIGSDAVARAAALLGVEETEPVDFFVYADQGAFYDALGPGTRENVGGQANAGIRTLFALITPAEINASWVESVIPHELTHLVFDTAVRNPYHFPPRWLNEGLAVYLAQGYGAADRAAVQRAVADGSLMPLQALDGQFPTTRDRFALAYAESVSAVDDLVAQHGEAALVQLIRSYADGVTDDEAFTAAIGTDAAGFDAEWRSRLGAGAPVTYGPRPAPDGPLPSDWTGPGATDAPVSGSGSSEAGPPPAWLVAAAAAVLATIGLLTLGLSRAATRSRAGRPRAPR
jgi:hypothetical protein